MNPKVKLALYVLLGAVFAFCVRGVLTTARQGSGGASTNAPAGTNLAATNLAVPPTNTVATNAASTNGAEAPADGVARKASPRMGRFMAYGIAGLFTLFGLALLIANDVSRFTANRVEEFIFNDDLKGVRDPQYEEAEEIWKKGDYLDAVQHMRDYYKRNPREVHVALRIAEIYESNLANYLAAALEYEEVLKKKLPPERWGWAAIHLANLYSGKLNKIDEATALLHRIVNEYGQTAAAKKARDRLGIPEPILTPVPDPEPVPKKASEAPPANLPPGFRPK